MLAHNEASAFVGRDSNAFAVVEDVGIVNGLTGLGIENGAGDLCK